MGCSCCGKHKEDIQLNDSVNCDGEQSTEQKKIKNRMTQPFIGDGTQWIPSPTYVCGNSSIRQISSDPTEKPTNELTLIYDLPSIRFKTEEQIIKSHGYEILCEVAKGGFAKIFKAKRLSDELIVGCKMIDLTNDADGYCRTDTKNEIFIMERTNHPNIVKIYYHFMIRHHNSSSDDKERVSVFIWMQWAQSDSLSKLMRDSEVRHMHQKCIAQRDLKMGNILLDINNKVIVSDFGLSRVAFRVSKSGTVMSYSYCGTVPYVSPELLSNRMTKKKAYNPFLVDIWALRVILYCMINKAYPFDESLGFDQMIECQINYLWKFSRHVRTTRSPELIDVLKRMLEPNCRKRITIAQLAEHPFIEPEIRNIPV